MRILPDFEKIKHQNEITKLKNKIIEKNTKLVVINARYDMLYDEAYPDVGMGLPFSYYIKNSIKKLKLKDDEVDLECLKGFY